MAKSQPRGHQSISSTSKIELPLFFCIWDLWAKIWLFCHFNDSWQAFNKSILSPPPFAKFRGGLLSPPTPYPQICFLLTPANHRQLVIFTPLNLPFSIYLSSIVKGIILLLARPLPTSISLFWSEIRITFQPNVSSIKISITTPPEWKTPIYLSIYLTLVCLVYIRSQIT